MTDPTATLPVPNIPLLRKAVEWAEAEAQKPEDQRQWNQTYWAQATECGTAYCLAGYTVMAAVPGAEAVLQLGGFDGDYDLHVNGEPALWSETAQEALGITRDERLDLFDGMNRIGDIRAAAERIAARAGERL